MTFYITNLGCKVNAYESKFMSDSLIKAGYIKGDVDNSDIYIINTCCVTNVAEHKSLQIIRRFKKKNPKLLIVTGCLGQIKPQDIEKIGVDIVLGSKDKSKIVDYINNYSKPITKIYDLSNDIFENMQIDNFDKTRAFVKIQDGCNNFCSYCIIPYTRGNIRSKDKDIVLEEISDLVNSGHKEVVLTGINTGKYGYEFNYDFASLLNDIVKIEGLKRLRISSIEITEINDRVKEVISNSNIIVDHIHIPLQGGSDEILKSMNRKYDLNYFIEAIESLRKIRPNINITTDVIVGFPGETEELFLKSIETIKKIKFSKMHVFPYSLREGTVAATMENQVDERIKKERVKILLNLSKELELEYMNKFLGSTLEFIPEVYKDGYLLGHTGNYLSIKVLGDESLLHDLVKVKIEKIEYPYCLAVIYK